MDNRPAQKIAAHWRSSVMIRTLRLQSLVCSMSLDSTLSMAGLSKKVGESNAIHQAMDPVEQPPNCERTSRPRRGTNKPGISHKRHKTAHTFLCFLCLFVA